MNTQLLPGKIEIQEEIAKGQTGTIYYGYDLELRQEMAIKVYHTHINGRLIRGKAFIEKAKSLLRLEHPNLIKIFKVEEQDGTPVVCMEFFDAPSLQHVIQNEGPLSVEKMLLLAREIAEVLVHIHFQGIIHGTLHPGHVLVGPQGQIKVMDLGLSWILMDILKNCDAELLRPLPYLLPETAKSELLTLGSDLYCLGFMMYDMLTTRVPYSGLPKTSIMGKLAFDQADPVFDFPDHVPKAICKLIRQMTRNQSSQRLQDATHVLTILNQQLAKFAPEVLRQPAAPAEPKPTPEIQTAKIETPSLPPQAPVSVPPPNQPTAVTR
ncbi:MAG: protein kinase, partial [Nitrospirales bacterium]